MGLYNAILCHPVLWFYSWTESTDQKQFDDLRKFRNEDFAYITREKKNWNESSLRVEQERSYKRMSCFLGARGWGAGGGVLS